ncbi:MAG: T9SS type A sorting domain-containing protein [Ignavibacteriaceae bacterium]
MNNRVNLASTVSVIITIFCFTNINLAQTNFWEPVGNIGEETILKLAYTQTGNMFAGSDSGLFHSTNMGENWTKLQNEFSTERIDNLKINSNDEIFASTRSGLFFSDDNGHTWSNKTSSLEFTWVRAFAILSDSELVINLVDSADAYPGSMYYSNDDGDTWTEVKEGLYGNGVNAKDFMVDKTDTVYVVALSEYTQSEYLYKFLKDDKKWVPVFRYAPSLEIAEIVSNQANIFFGAEHHGVMKSYDEGVDWISAHLYPKTIETLLPVSDSALYAGTFTFGVYYSDDNGETWTQKSSGLNTYNSSIVLSMIIYKDNHLYAGTAAGLFRSKNVITSINDEENTDKIPTGYSLLQNYPNPFNPSTTISYQLVKGGKVTLKVYDVLGEEIVTLINEYKPTGRYEVEFDAANLPSGVYFYQLRAGDFIQTKKMLLLK